MSGKAVSTESEWRKYLHTFLIRKPPKEGTWARNAAMHKSLVIRGFLSP